MLEILKYFAREFPEYRKKVVVALLVNIILVSLNFVISYFSKNLIDNISNLESQKYWSFVAFILLFYALYCLISLFNNYIAKKISLGMKKKLQAKLYTSFQEAPYLTVNFKSPGELYFKICTDINIILEFFLFISLSVPVNILIVITSCTIMMTFSYKLSLVLIGLTLIHSIVLILFKKPLKKVSKNRLLNDQNYAKTVIDGFTNNELARSYYIENKFLIDVNNSFDKFAKEALKETNISSLSNNICSFLGQLINFFVLFVGLYFVYQNQLTLGNLYLIFTMITYFSKSILALLNVYPKYILSTLSFRRFNDAIHNMDKNRYFGDKIFDFKCIIFFDNVSFAYGRKKVLTNFSCKFLKNKINIIQGNNGSGKSTILKLLNKFLYLTDGTIFIDDVNINEINYDNFKENVSYMPSKDYFVDGTIEDNITLYKKYSFQQIDYVIKQCGLEQILEKCENGIKTNFGSIRGKFSDGELKKICLARTFIENKKIVCMDEPTSFLDFKATNEIISIILNISKEKKITFIISTHDEKLKGIGENIIQI